VADRAPSAVTVAEMWIDGFVRHWQLPEGQGIPASLPCQLGDHRQGLTGRSGVVGVSSLSLYSVSAAQSTWQTISPGEIALQRREGQKLMEIKEMCLRRLTILQLSWGNEAGIRKLKLTFMFATEYNKKGQTFLGSNDDLWQNASEFAACLFP